MCGETSPAFMTWLGEVNLSGRGGERGGAGRDPSRDWEPTICQRHGGGRGVAKGCLGGVENGVHGLCKADVVFTAKTTSEM